MFLGAFDKCGLAVGEDTFAFLIAVGRVAHVFEFMGLQVEKERIGVVRVVNFIYGHGDLPIIRRDEVLRLDPFSRTLVFREICSGQHQLHIGQLWHSGLIHDVAHGYVILLAVSPGNAQARAGNRRAFIALHTKRHRWLGETFVEHIQATGIARVLAGHFVRAVKAILWSAQKDVAVAQIVGADKAMMLEVVGAGSDALGRNVILVNVAVGAVEKHEAFPVVSPVRTLAKPCQLRDVWREIVRRVAGF